MNDQYEKPIVWAAETSKKGEKEKRNKNALGQMLVLIIRSKNEHARKVDTELSND